MPKPTNAIVRRRLEQLLRIRLRGAQFADVRQFADEADPETGRPWLTKEGKPISDRQLKRYCQQSDQLLDKHLEKNFQMLFNRHRGRCQELYALALESGDIRGALAVAQEEARLLNLYPKEPTGRDVNNTQVNIWAPVLQRMTDEQLAVLIPLAEQALKGVPTNGHDQPCGCIPVIPAEPISVQPAPGGYGAAGAVPPVLPGLCGPVPDPQ
jgi:hypothetical protein